MKRIVFLLVFFVCYACDKKPNARVNESTDKTTVLTVNYPLYYFAKRIGGEHIDLKYLIPSDVDPAYWMPNEKDLIAYQQVDVIFANGANYAKWMGKVSLPSNKIINTASLVQERLITVISGAKHSHGPEGEHVHDEVAFTLWLDFEVAVQQAKIIKLKLERIKPNQAKVFNENFEELENDLQSLHTRMTQVSDNFKGGKMMGSHPVYQYLARAYQLEIKSAHLEPGTYPSTDQWHDLEHLLKDADSKLMIWEDKPVDQTLNELTNRNIKSVVFDPCANIPETGDFLSVMQNNIAGLETLMD